MSELPSLSSLERLILELILVSPGDPYGLDLVERSAGRLKRGSVYVTLHRMEEKGFISSYEENRPALEGGLPRRRYTVTGLGQRTLHHWTVPTGAAWAPA
jgi:DNA-binding PadR family transcriptional regulator